MNEQTLPAAAVFDKIPGNHLVLLADAPRFTIVAVTDAYLASTYTKREQLMGKGIFEVFPLNADDARRTGGTHINASLHQVAKERKPHLMDDQRYDVINPQTGRFEYKIWRPLSKPVFSDDGKLQYIIHSVEDVTENQRLEEESRIAGQRLGESENRFRHMVEQAPVSILLSRGEDLVTESVNAPMLQFIHKSSAEEVLGKTLLEALPELKDQPVMQILSNVLKTGIPWRGDETPVELVKDGKLEQRYFNISYTPIVEAGTVTSVLHVATDVTQQVQTRLKIEEMVSQRTNELARVNEELTATNIELTRSNNNLEEFTHAVSHDLKEPIRKINFFSKQLGDLLIRNTLEAEGGLLTKIVQATQRMSNLIDDLLQYSHVSQRPQQIETVDLSQIVQGVSQELEFDIHQKGATIETRNLPVVQGYSTQLVQLFQNILSNALKYSKKEVPPHIIVSAGSVVEQGRHYHSIEVKDNGIGFDQQYAERIFQMFSRLHGRNEYSGTGVGLSIVKKILENHQGFIRAEGKPGEGSTFFIYLPVR
ncbi:MAG: PAS domain-containing protein [Williamsia sp.]|nr:PAS domain-containing protein [Williamsia sp.]